MNKHEVRGGARYVGGKIEKAVGDAVDRRDWQVAGVVDQVAGAGENMFGRAQSVAEDVADATPGLIDHAREKLDAAADRATDAARRGARSAADLARQGDDRLLWAAGALIGGYALGWLVHGRRD
ncbi:CsbD family protein [Roseomonas aeriglobus]|nr:CsbD family protein [Roseomonas aeriglobus]